MTAATGLPAILGENLQSIQCGKEQTTPDSRWPGIPRYAAAERVTAQLGFLLSRKAFREAAELGIRSRAEVVPPLNLLARCWLQAAQKEMVLRSRASKAVTTNHIFLLTVQQHPCGQPFSGRAAVASHRWFCWRHLPGDRTWLG